MTSVSELTVWNLNMIDIASSYRTSTLRVKEFKEILPGQGRSYLPHHEVRFPLLLIQIREAVLT